MIPADDRKHQIFQFPRTGTLGREMMDMPEPKIVGPHAQALAVDKIKDISASGYAGRTSKGQTILLQILVVSGTGYLETLNLEEPTTQK